MQTHVRQKIALLLLALVLAPLAAHAAASGVVNVNTATAQQLELLPRVGPSVAARIVEQRKASGGRFNSLDDLMLVQGIGEKSLAALKPYLTLSGETTLKEKVKSPRTSSSSPATTKRAPAKRASAPAAPKPGKQG